MKAKKIFNKVLEKAAALVLVLEIGWLLVTTIHMSYATKIDGQWIRNTPIPTATPENFLVTVEILQFDKNVDRMRFIDVLWIVKVVESERPLPQKKFFLGLTDKSKLELKRGSKIQLMCRGTSWARVEELDCSQDYKIVP